VLEHLVKAGPRFASLGGEYRASHPYLSPLTPNFLPCFSAVRIYQKEAAQLTGNSNLQHHCGFIRVTRICLVMSINKKQKE
jgi:hypothetical protein